ncbi:hypothetical protein D6D15_05896 [Aureobasidium pullulans]|uniref:Something about silencing protein 4 domain-containing protein n=1 Tax=Aureobasidium pullulans TaxID=5580 RepID=A0A4S9B6S1_AURPU|nr:hypothetical protein D6D15_05896 [Aureobasidium pullulans]
MTPLQLWLKGPPERSNRETGQDSTQQQHTAEAADDEHGQVEQESWSSAIKSMVNSLRPTSTRSPSRRASVRHPTPPPSQLSSTSPRPLSDENEAIETPKQSDRPAKRLKLTLKGPKLAAVPADVVGNTNATIPSPRPPVKLTLSEPHGNLLQTTNGVRKTLDVTEDSIPSNTSPATTPASALDPPQRETRKTSERRSLRSHDEGPRLKSELAVYFPNYEDIIYDSNKEPEFITTDTIIHISNEPYNPAQDPNYKPDTLTSHPRTQRASASPTKPSSPPNQKNKYNGAQVIDFSSIEKSVGHHPKDPLTDAFYFPSHRRAERKEKQLRNIEKERAMHEKAHLERLLEALQGHDWLRVMGINSVVDADAKKYEPKRKYFVDELNALLLKFKTWKDEERRIRQEKEAAAMAGAEDEDEDEDEESESEPSSSDLDASAARQLQIEASGGAKGGKDGKAGKLKSKTKASAPVPEPAPPPPAPLPTIYREPTPDGPFVSFYSKPHMRASALGTTRHGRTLTAFGVPLPEVEEQDFALPEDYVTPDALRDNARKRRRMKRESAMDSSK